MFILLTLNGNSILVPVDNIAYVEPSSKGSTVWLKRVDGMADASVGLEVSEKITDIINSLNRYSSTQVI